MSPVLKLALLLVAALMVGRVSWRPSRAGFGIVFAMGTHFLLFGIVLGPVTGVLSRDVLRALSPFLVLGLGWTGMLIGTQLDRGQLRWFPVRLPIATVLQGTLAFAAAWVCAWLVITLARPADPFWSPAGPAVLTLCGITAVSAPAAVAIGARSVRAHGPVVRLLLYFASLDGLVGLLIVAGTFALHRAGLPSAGGGQPVWLWLVISGCSGLLVGGLFLSLTRAKPTPDELVLFLAGTTLFGSGAAYALHLSPLVVCCIAGAVIANLSRFRMRVYATLSAWEKPIYGTFLILAGAMLRPPGWSVVPLVVGLLLVRAVAKVFGTWAALRLTGAGRGPRHLGLALFAQGGLALAIAIGYAINFGETPAANVDLVMAAVVLAVACSELAGPALMRTVLARATEAVPPAAPA